LRRWTRWTSARDGRGFWGISSPLARPPARHATSFLALSQIYFLGSFLESFPECTHEYFLEYFPECTLEYFLEYSLELYFLENMLENFIEFFLKLCQAGSRDAAVRIDRSSSLNIPVILTVLLGALLYSVVSTGRGGTPRRQLWLVSG
jgi:hypothetical protein